jgi:hypothetical protein
LLCGIYARTEAMHGNIEQARKIFDMALLSTEATTEVNYEVYVFLSKFAWSIPIILAELCICNAHCCWCSIICFLNACLQVWVSAVNVSHIMISYKLKPA